MSIQPIEIQTILHKQLAAFSEHTPRIHCIANYVTANACANLLLAIGASPIMADAPEEAADITKNSQSLMINLGTPNAQRMQTISNVGKAAMHYQVPIVLDPVGCGTSVFRHHFILNWLSTVRPSVIRGNFAEITALSANAPLNDLHDGIDSTAIKPITANAIKLAKETALKYQTIIILSGSVDIVTDGYRTFTVNNGCWQMSKITGMGCMLSAFLSAVISHPASRSPLDMAIATAIFGYTGELAASLQPNDGLGTFYQTFWDTISTLSFDMVKRGLHIEHQ
ncbi:hydroxyethylthiazole kinase [Fusibacter paucivorans]|uniref:Hydroxyethylthiazole kinase n=1 Tax=Fusibacter paucivorans TaxID=76009 RepID=A0ABS5PUN1_9FIRM|nr:hydroxyethylthiazole kinase [Fusibacter paucivorans]MBS7528642.1 hydroxyethylthiazole kinase [Fusibacter paucivorans]